MSDEERFRAIIDKAIADGEVEAFKAYTKESAASKKRRRQAATSEAKEAEEYAKELGVHDQLFNKDRKESVTTTATTKGKKRKGVEKGKGKGKREEDTSALEALIKNRQAGRMDAMIAGLEAKYASGSKKKRDAPTEEEFEAARAKVTGGKRKRAKA